MSLMKPNKTNKRTKDFESCAWVYASGKPCIKDATCDTRYCNSHYYMSDEFMAIVDGYQVPADKKIDYSEDYEQEWKESVEVDSVKKYRVKDFPCTIDGMYYKSLREYSEMGEYLETQDYAQDYEFGYSSYRSQNHLYNDLYEQPKLYKNTFNSIPLAPTVYKTKSLKMNEWDVVESIGTMKYVIVHAMDGKYYAVWLSCYSDFDETKAMHYIRKNCPQSTPVKRKGFGFYTSGDCIGYSSADLKLTKGAETFWKIKKRYKDTGDPDWIPYNLREIAYAKLYHLVPEEWQEKVMAWVKKGCPGWFKVKYSVTQPTQPKPLPIVINNVPVKHKPTSNTAFENVSVQELIKTIESLEVSCTSIPKGDVKDCHNWNDGEWASYVDLVSKQNDIFLAKAEIETREILKIREPKLLSSGQQEKK